MIYFRVKTGKIIFAYNESEGLVHWVFEGNPDSVPYTKEEFDQYIMMDLWKLCDKDGAVLVNI